MEKVMSRSWPMLMLRGSTYYYHRNVPKRLRPLLGGKAQIWKSLRTSNLDVAKLRSLEEGQRVERMFQALALRANSAQTDPGSLARLYSSRAEADDAAWRSRRVVDTDEQLNVELDALTSAVEDHAAALRLKDVDIVSGLLDDVLIENGLTIPAHRRREFALALLHARLKTLEVGVKRTKGEIAGERLEDQGITVDGLLVAYLTERKLGSKSEHEVRAAYRRFTAIVGGEKPAREVDKKDCRAYKASLLAAPSNRSLSKDGKLSPVSVKKLLGICATVFRYGVGQGHLDTNPFEGITRVVRGDHQRVGRLPYDSADLTAIFASPEFSKLTGAKRWIPLIAALSGCRVEEVAGLRVRDIGRDGEVRFFDFVPTSERRLKNVASQARTPIHPELLRLGLLDYVASVPQGGRLFPEIQPGPHGRLSGAFSKWFARFVDERGVRDPRKVGLHSLRHLFKDRCRAAGLSEELHDALTRHSGGSVGRRYGLGPSLPVLAEALARVSFPELKGMGEDR
jgi:integrase